MMDRTEFFYGMLTGGGVPLLLWVFTAGRWRQTLVDFERRLSVLEGLISRLLIQRPSGDE